MLRLGAIAFIAVTWVPSAFAETPVFGPLVSTSVGFPDSMALADFNADGKQDIVVTDSTDGVVAIQYGKGDGTFGTPVTLFQGGTPNAVVTADLEHNGSIYVLVSDLMSDTVTVLKSEGRGKFVRTYVVNGVSVWHIRMVDFNGDGVPDMALVLYGGQDGSQGVKVQIYPGLGNGMFGVPFPIDVGAQASDISSGDLNGDGIPDLVISDFDESRLLVYLATSPGRYASPSQIKLNLAPECIQLLKNPVSGHLDIISEEVNLTGGEVNPGETAYGQVDVFAGNGDGTFQAPQSYATPDGSTAMVVADLNGDHIPDLLLTYPDLDAIGILLGTGDGTYVERGAYRTGYTPLNTAVGDFDDDGKPDIVSANRDSASLSVLVNEGSGAFPAAREYSSLSQRNAFPIGKLFGLFNLTHDGHPNFIDASIRHLGAGTDCLDVTLLSATGGILLPASQPIFNCTPWTQIVGGYDMNGDGNIDLVLIGPTGLGIAYGNGDGTFSQPIALGLDVIGTVWVVDIDGDGRPDIVQDTSFFNLGQWVSFVIDKQMPDGTFVAGTPIQLPKAPQFSAFSTIQAFGDFNHDGLMDIVTAAYVPKPSDTFQLLPQISIYLNRGNGVFQLKSQHTYGIDEVIEVTPSDNVVTDFNGDGAPDIVVAAPNGFTVLLNDGQGRLQPPVSYPAGVGCVSLGYGDVDGDGVPDIICLAQASFFVAHGNGDGTFSIGPIIGGLEGAELNAIPAPQVFVGDFNGDGKSDLLFQAGVPRLVMPFTSESSTVEGSLILFLDHPIDQPVPPATFYQRYATKLDQPLNIPLSFSDETGQAAQIDILSGPTNGTWSVGGTNGDTIFYKSDHHALGAFTISYQVTTANGTSNVGYIDVAVADSDRVPAAPDEAHGIPKGLLYSGHFPGSDGDGDPLIYSIASLPRDGVVQLIDATTGTYTYLPNAGFRGLDILEYQVCDWEHCSTGSERFNVGTVSPSAVDGKLLVDRNTLAHGIALGLDKNGNPRSKVGNIFFEVMTPPSHGTLTLDNDGNFRYQPHLDYSGPDSFTFFTTDSKDDSNIATVSITVQEHPPVAKTSRRAVLRRGGSYSAQAMGYDPDAGDTLVFEVTEPPHHGTVMMAPGGRFTYTPDPGFQGDDKFRFAVTDGALTSRPAELQFTVW